MARTASNMMPLGTVAPNFILPDTISGKTMALNQIKGEKGTVIMFICNHCPYVKHVNPVITQLADKYQSKGIAFIGISSNDVENYPQDAPHLMKQTAIDEKYSFPYLYDESQEVARTFEAACTPDFYLFDKKLGLIYRGQLDDSRPGNEIPPSGIDLSEALEALLNNTPLNQVQKPSIGCNIKWK